MVASAHRKEESEQKYDRAAYLRICRTIQCMVRYKKDKMVKIKKTGLSWNNVSAKDANSCGDRFCADEACKRLEDIILSLSSR